MDEEILERPPFLFNSNCLASIPRHSFHMAAEAGNDRELLGQMPEGARTVVGDRDLKPFEPATTRPSGARAARKVG